MKEGNDNMNTRRSMLLGIGGSSSRRYIDHSGSGECPGSGETWFSGLPSRYRRLDGRTAR